jgi:RNA polymerase sigma factor (TIGR02999 family)
MSSPQNVTQLLGRIEQGDPAAADKLLPLVYEELRLLAAKNLSREQPGQTLQATALVHEAWVRLVDVNYEQQWSSRRHFFGAAAEAMRRILVDKARRRNREKHGSEWERITVNLADIPDSPPDEQILSLHEALEKLEGQDTAAAELVKLRYFAGLTAAEAAKTLDLSDRTADRMWAYAKAWLLREIRRTSES